MNKPNFKNNKMNEILRVNHAGEYGAKRIYEGQLRFTQSPDNARLIKEMLQHEQVHLDYFADKLISHNARPTALLFIWHKVGYLLGAGSALLGTKTAMLVTQAVEEVIEKHYQEQIDYLKEKGIAEDLLKNIQQFQLDEIAHKNIAIVHKSEEVFLAHLATPLIKILCKVAIEISKKI